jgi:hypothetical protein
MNLFRRRQRKLTAIVFLGFVGARVEPLDRLLKIACEEAGRFQGCLNICYRQGWHDCDVAFILKADIQSPGGD